MSDVESLGLGMIGSQSKTQFNSILFNAHPQQSTFVLQRIIKSL